MENTSDSELRYRIRAKAQLLCAHADMIYQLSSEIGTYLDNPSDFTSYKKAEEQLAALVNVTDQTNQLTKEIRNHKVELNKKLINH
jgi:hypothetical protein